ncbi:MAG TPA: type II toxin-antitoxin system prevent-host-death family antitoxin [Thermoanaerobaculia bacterium]|nr:type II toxin-antitoxin system prevent-host-death family antitoxin [Thermoanaerobaculia bacterium]
MRTVGIRELKNCLSEYVRRVRRGEEFLVTDRGEAVAELRAPTPAGARRSLHPGIADLARQGVLTLGEENSPSIYPRLPQILPQGSAEELLAEERLDAR